MSVTVADVIRNARDMAPVFDERWTTNAVLLRGLSRYQQTLLAKIADWKRDALVTTEEIDFPLIEHDEGETIPAHILVHGGSVVFTDTNRDPVDLRLVEYRFRNDRHRFQYAAYIQGTKFYPLGKAEDWTGVLRVDLDYFPQGTALTALASTFTLPDDPLDVLTAFAANLMASRAEKDAPIDRQGFTETLVVAESNYLDQVTGRNRAVVSGTQEVW